MLPKCLLANKNNHRCSPLNKNVTHGSTSCHHQNSFGGNTQTAKYLCRQFVSNTKTAKILILGVTLYNGNVIQIKLNISEPYGTFASLVRCVSRI